MDKNTKDPGKTELDSQPRFERRFSFLLEPVLCAALGFVWKSFDVRDRACSALCSQYLEQRIVQMLIKCAETCMQYGARPRLPQPF